MAGDEPSAAMRGVAAEVTAGEAGFNYVDYYEPATRELPQWCSAVSRYSNVDRRGDAAMARWVAATMCFHDMIV